MWFLWTNGWYMVFVWTNGWYVIFVNKWQACISVNKWWKCDLCVNKWLMCDLCVNKWQICDLCMNKWQICDLCEQMADMLSLWTSGGYVLNVVFFFNKWQIFVECNLCEQIVLFVQLKAVRIVYVCVVWLFVRYIVTVLPIAMPLTSKIPVSVVFPLLIKSS